MTYFRGAGCLATSAQHLNPGLTQPTETQQHLVSGLTDKFSDTQKLLQTSLNNSPAALPLPQSTEAGGGGGIPTA